MLGQTSYKNKYPKEVEILAQGPLCQYNFRYPQTLFYPGYYLSDFFGG